MARRPKAAARPTDFAEKWRLVQAKIASGESNPPEPHPELAYHWKGVAVNIVEMKAEIQREWEKYFAQPFPGWSPDAIAGVASYAKVPAHDLERESSIIIYRKAIAQKQRRFVAIKPGKSLRLVPAEQQSADVPNQTSEFVSNKFQRSILNALAGRALNKEQLANEVCNGEGSRLYNSKTRKGDLNELRDLGLVQHKPRLGYYRPDAPPAD